MNITSLITKSRSMLHEHLAPSRPTKPEASLLFTPREDHLKARALQRWENEGGKILSQPQRAS